MLISNVSNHGPLNQSMQSATYSSLQIHVLKQATRFQVLSHTPTFNHSQSKKLNKKLVLKGRRLIVEEAAKSR